MPGRRGRTPEYYLGADEIQHLFPKNIRAYFDTALQTNVLIGGIIESRAAIIESNQVAYADCFYDFRGLLQAVKLAADSASPTVTQFRYDTLGNLITQEDAEKRVTRFEYDSLGRRVKRILPGGSVQGFGFDSVTWQNQTLARSFVTNFNGQVIVITNDSMGRIMSKALPARPDAGLAATWVSYAYNRYELFSCRSFGFFFVAGFFQNSRTGIRLRPASARQVVFCNQIAMNWSQPYDTVGRFEFGVSG